MKKAKIIIYFDYELQQGADKCNPPRNWGLEDYNNTNKLLNILDSYNTKVCFATVARIAKDNKLPYGAKKQVIKIYNKGHEIASHSMNHDQFSEFNKKEFVKDLIESKTLLENTIKEKVLTYVPPRNLPYNFLGFPINLYITKNYKKIPYIQDFNLKKVYSCIDKAGYKIYREYNFIFKFKNKYEKKLFVNKLDFNSGFDKKKRDYILKNINKRKYITVYGHTHSLSGKSNQSFKELETFLIFLKKNNIKTILPKETLKDVW